MKIDWKDKVTVAQVDTRGKGYAPAARPSPPRSAEVAGFFRESREEGLPGLNWELAEHARSFAIQTVPFRDPSCQGFGALFLYNTDTQATCWFSSLRIKQSQEDMVLQDTDALAARRDLADRLKQREYQMAVDADMEVGMKMGAIKSTSCHGMNLAMEQAANNASSHAMG
ncbi:Endonuclease 8-like 3 [Durusdinium trenchii]|uniref:Endonuclease 8-like 3 n=1 Tax=Durusdinium trenchii TaxID=1381693 RepID=A0ABP0NTF5_9DINO